MYWSKFHFPPRLILQQNKIETTSHFDQIWTIFNLNLWKPNLNLWKPNHSLRPDRTLQNVIQIFAWLQNIAPILTVELNTSWYLLMELLELHKITKHITNIRSLLPLNLRAYRSQIGCCPIEKHSLGKFYLCPIKNMILY